MILIKKIGVLSFAKFYAATMAIVGVFLGLMVLFFSLFAGQNQDLRFFGNILDYFAIIIFPVSYGIFGFIIGAITAFFYNLVAKFGCGVEIEIKK